MKLRKGFLASFVIFAVCLLFPASGVCLTSQQSNLVKKFKTVFARGDKKEIAKYVRYPLKRETPIPAIKNAKEFVERFNDVFDAELSRLINRSDIQKDWHAVGWEGIMLGGGEIWLSTEGKLIAVNYQSEAERIKKQTLIKSGKQKLHSSLQKYLEPVLEWKTKRFRIRIDRVGKDKYRYASWSVKKSPSQKPDLVLKNGGVTYEGSGGNHFYEFKSGIYKYRCYVYRIGTETTPPGELVVYKKNKQILSEDVVKVLAP